MLKFFLVMFFSFGVVANTFGDEKPKEWTEDDQDHSTSNLDSFLNETRLKCVSDGISKITGKKPSLNFLGLLALRVREINLEYQDANGDTIPRKQLNKNDNITYQEIGNIRKPYLTWITHYISTYGFCDDSYDKKVFDDLPLEKRHIKKSNNHYYFLNRLSESIMTENKTSEKIITEFNKKITGVDSLNFAQNLFPRKSSSGENFIDLQYNEKNNIAATRTEKASKEVAGIISDGQFKDCLDQMKSNKETPGANKLCSAIQKSCGYTNDTSFCSGFDLSPARPSQSAQPVTSGR